jgi:hypothetical protein
MKRVALALLALASPWLRPAVEASPIPVDPPHRSEMIDCVRTRTGFTLPAMHIEADATYTHTKIEDLRHEDIDLTGDTFYVSGALGIADWLTAKAILPIHRRDFTPGGVEYGIGDIELEAKLSFRKDLSPVGFVPVVDVCGGILFGLPTGDEDKGLGMENLYVKPYASASYWFLPWVGMHGWVYFELMEGDRPFHGGSAVAELLPFSRDLSLYGGMEFRQQGFDSPEVVLLPGIEYRVVPMVSVGLGTPVGISHRAEDWSVILNLQLSF